MWQWWQGHSSWQQQRGLICSDSVKAAPFCDGIEGAPHGNIVKDDFVAMVLRVLPVASVEGALVAMVASVFPQQWHQGGYLW